jgi:hypothetical protein
VCGVVQLMKSHMGLEYNDSQMHAIEAGLDGTPLVLIQVCDAPSHSDPQNDFATPPSDISHQKQGMWVPHLVMSRFQCRKSMLLVHCRSSILWHGQTVPDHVAVTSDHVLYS